ncbi:MAG: hypothetical protein HQK93_09705, partial [Nitrospirae bacterium]|nr:hypothetical protein [Nitrospirota bacterium]
MWEKYKDKIIINSYSDFGFNKHSENIIRDDKKINFSEINPRFLLEKSYSLNIYFKTFGALCRDKISIKNKTILLIETGKNINFTDIINLLFNEYVSYDNIRIDVLISREIDAAKYITTFNMNSIITDLMPID